MSIWFKKVSGPYGWMGNMAPYPIYFNGEMWRTSEALFQALRYANPSIMAQIQAEQSPMGANMVAKSGVNTPHRVIVPMSRQDVQNMKLCVMLKFTQHPNLSNLLLATGNQIIFEDASGRKKVNDLFWGAHPNPANPNVALQGNNVMGEILMEIRAIL